MKLLVIGCGSIGRRHALSTRQLGWQLAVADIDPQRAAVVARETGAEVSFADLDEAIAWGPDAAVIATPHIRHIEHARRMARVGVDILIEKPLSHTLDGIEDLNGTCARHGVRAWVVSNMRFHPAVKALAAALPRIGRVYYARSHYGDYLPSFRPGRDYRELYCARRESGGGLVLDGAIHEIDLVMWLFGPVRRVRGTVGHLSELEIDVEDFADLGLEHESGVRSMITFDYFRRWARRGMEIVGEGGQIIWASEGKAPEHCSVRLYDAGAETWQTLFEDAELDDTPMYAEMLEAFGRAREGADVPLQTLRQGAERLRIALAARDAEVAA